MRNYASFRLTSQIALICAMLSLFNAFGSNCPVLALFCALAFISSFAAVRLSQPALRFIVGLAPLISLVLLKSPQLPCVIAAAAMSLYCAFTLAAGRFGMELWQYRKEVILTFSLLFALFIASVLVNVHRPLTRVLIACSAVLSLLSLRALRAGNKLSFNWQAGNSAFLLLPIIGFAAVGALVWLAAPLGKPIAQAIAWIWAGIIMAFNYINTFLFRGPVPSDELPEATPEPTEDEFFDYEALFGPSGPRPSNVDFASNIDWKTILIIIGALLFITAMVFLIRGTRGKKTRSAAESFEFELEPTEKRSRRRRGKRRKDLSNAEKIRAVYRNYLSFLSVNGIHRRTSSTTQDISEESGQILLETDELLRSAYRRARYASDEVTDEEVDRANEIYLRLVNDNNLKKQ